MRYATRIHLRIRCIRAKDWPTAVDRSGGEPGPSHRAARSGKAAGAAAGSVGWRPGRAGARADPLVYFVCLPDHVIGQP